MTEDGIPNALFDALAPFRAAKLGVLISSPDRGITFRATAYENGHAAASANGKTQPDALNALALELKL